MNYCEHPVLHEEFDKPMPMKHRGRHRPPVEDESERDAWLPPSHPYPEVSSALRTMAVTVLGLLLFLTTILFFLWLVLPVR